MLSRISIVVFVLVLGGCSASWHLNKAIQKDPGIIVNDTIYSVDTVWRTVQSIDTVFKVTKSDTTIIVNKDSVIIKHFYNHSDSTVYIEADCPDCPEIKESTQLPAIKITPSIWQQLKNTLPITLLILILAIVLIRKIK